MATAPMTPPTSRGTYFSWSKVRPNTCLPAGLYDFAVTDVRPQQSREKGLAMYIIELAVISPQTKNGELHLEYCVFGHTPFEYTGNDKGFAEYAALDDPDGIDPITHEYSSGMRQFRHLLETAGIEFNDDKSMEDIVNEVQQGGIQVGARVTVAETNQGGARNNLAGFYPVGQHVAKIADPDTPKGKPGASAARQAAGGSSNGRRTAGAAAGAASAQGARTRAAVEQQSEYTDEDEAELD